ncbi:MAG: hypothetical protein ACXAC7_10925 [Candidatus Hodarchaeales archaeon]|jgi:hypothetical protein
MKLKEFAQIFLVISFPFLIFLLIVDEIIVLAFVASLLSFVVLFGVLIYQNSETLFKITSIEEIQENVLNIANYSFKSLVVAAAISLPLLIVSFLAIEFIIENDNTEALYIFTWLVITYYASKRIHTVLPSEETSEKSSDSKFPIVTSDEGYYEWRLKEIRKQRLLKLIKKTSRMSKDEFMDFMDFTDSKRFFNWIISLPDNSLIKLDGDDVIFSNEESRLSIDDLVRLYQEIEEEDFVNYFKAIKKEKKKLEKEMMKKE